MECKANGIARNIIKKGDLFSIFEGEFVDGKPYGFGRLIKSNGEVL